MCVEVRFDGDRVMVRDSVTRDVIAVSRDDWRAFCTAIKMDARHSLK
jgi:hypothetical protein